MKMILSLFLALAMMLHALHVMAETSYTSTAKGFVDAINVTGPLNDGGSIKSVVVGATVIVAEKMPKAGGNALAGAIVFGRIAGEYAALSNSSHRFPGEAWHKCCAALLRMSGNAWNEADSPCSGRGGRGIIQPHSPKGSDCQ